MTQHTLQHVCEPAPAVTVHRLEVDGDRQPTYGHTLDGFYYRIDCTACMLIAEPGSEFSLFPIHPDDLIIAFEVAMNHAVECECLAAVAEIGMSDCALEDD